jgi:catechol 2,3-dioxygenase-like lactoylglutathione lyase family enzyme
LAVSRIHHATLIIDDEKKADWFYGELLGLEAKPRPRFDFPGLFYFCGEAQELHLITAARPNSRPDDLFIRIGGSSEITRNYIHRHVALIVSDFAATKQKLKDNHVNILFDADTVGEGADPFTINLIQGWIKMYGAPPFFCLDPFGNLLEIIPGSGEDVG